MNQIDLKQLLLFGYGKLNNGYCFKRQSGQVSMRGIGRYSDKFVAFFAENLGHITNKIMEIKVVYKWMQEAFKIGQKKLLNKIQG